MWSRAKQELSMRLISFSYRCLLGWHPLITSLTCDPMPSSALHKLQVLACRPRDKHSLAVTPGQWNASPVAKQLLECELICSVSFKQSPEKLLKLSMSLNSVFQQHPTDLSWTVGVIFLLYHQTPLSSLGGFNSSGSILLTPT